MAAGSVEEWTLTNTSPMDHPFHLHVWPMQIIQRNGQGKGSACLAGRGERARERARESQSGVQ